MGTLQLECPMCCSETFSTVLSLKYHLLNIIDNLLCTICGKKFNSVKDLVDHLGNECEVKLERDETPVSHNDADIVEDEEEKQMSDYVDQDESEEAQENHNIKIEQQDVVEDLNEPEQDETDNELYQCSSCNVSFYNVQEHLDEFHKGQEVLIENDENVGENNLEGMENKEYMDAIAQEECTDQAGRVFTRKVVQFDMAKIRPPPSELYFAISDGKAARIDKDQFDQLQAKDSMRVYQCTLCSSNFTKFDTYESHVCPDKSGVHQCTMCKAHFLTARSLSTHMRWHTKKKAAKQEEARSGPFICELCTTEFHSFKSLRLHQRMHEPVKSKEVEAPVKYGIMGDVPESEIKNEDLLEERQMFTCHICNKEYDEVYRNVHLNSHTETENYNCHICNRPFFTEANLEMHMRVHNTEKTHRCTYCKKEFADVDSLQTHVKEHLETRPYPCQYCNRRFIRPHEKVKHERIHTGEKPHVCDLCGKAFRVSYCLTLHMRSHSGIRPYQCKQCGRCFKAHSVYNHHLLIHSNVRNYKCPYCPKAFKTAVQLAGHKNTHTKPFTCTQCNRPFASLYAVRSHMETHKHENNLKYNCFICGASYARVFALRDHVKTHHQDDNWEAVIDQLEEGNVAAEPLIEDENSTSNVMIADQNSSNVLIAGENGSNVLIADDSSTNNVLILAEGTIVESVEAVEAIEMIGDVTSEDLEENTIVCQ